MASPGIAFETIMKEKAGKCLGNAWEMAGK
jgi:hypothetical protein